MNKNLFDGHLVFKGSKNFTKVSGRLKHNNKLKKITKFFEKKILNKKNQLFRNSKMVCINGSSKCFNKSKKIFIKDGFNYHICGCDMVYVNPVLKDQIFHTNLYNENSYTEVMRNKPNLMLDNKKFKYGLKKVNNKKKIKKVLDIGCGFGFFLDVARKEGWDVFGSEINKECIKVLNKKKIPNINIENCGKETFDLITLWTVYEHLIDPNGFLKKVLKLLKINGKIIINIPNIDSLSARILHDKCSMFHGHQHLNFYSPKTLGALFKKNNLKIENLETVISDIDTVRNHISYQKPYEGDSNKNFYFLNPNVMHKNLMGYTILAVTKKNK